VLKEDRFSQNDSIIEGLLDVQGQFFTLERSVQKIRDGNVDVLASKVKENGSGQKLFHDLFGGSRTLNIECFFIGCASDSLGHIFFHHSFNNSLR